ncbi:hypothetical protein AHAS_Ahas11G0242500 [Arachis hypogaea]
MNIILQDVAYQLGLRIDRGPISGCIGGWEQHHDGHPIEDFCQQLLGIVLGPEDRQSQTKWTVKLSWFQNTICGDVEEDPTEERLLCYTRGYIMQVIRGILIPDASDSRVHIRWLPLLEDLHRCGRLSWGSAMLAWLYCQMFVPRSIVSAIWVVVSVCHSPGPITVCYYYGRMDLRLVNFR